MHIKPTSKRDTEGTQHASPGWDEIPMPWVEDREFSLGLFWLILSSGRDTLQISHAGAPSGFTALPFTREDVCYVCSSSRGKVRRHQSDGGQLCSAPSPRRRPSPQTYTAGEFACKATAFGPTEVRKMLALGMLLGMWSFPSTLSASALRTLVHQSRRATAADLPLLKHTDLVQQFYTLHITLIFSPPADNQQTSSLTTPDVW